MPPDPQRLELEQDLAFQQRSWRVQRVAWIVLALIVMAGLAGVTGGGPLSRAAVATEDGRLRVEYERFVRMQAPSQLKLYFGKETVRGGEMRVWFDRGYIEQIKLDQIVPQPLRTEASADRLTYVFAATDGQAGALAIDLQLQRFGRASARLGVGDATLEFRQLVFP